MTNIFKSVLTGPGLIRYGVKKFKEARSEAKAQKKEHAQNQKMAKKGMKMAFEKEKQAAPIYKQGLKNLGKQLGGRHDIPSDLQDIISRYEKAGQGAAKIFEPIKKAALYDYNQNVTPTINTALGSDSKSSSALNQALAASGENLQRNLASDFSGIQNQLAQNLLGQSQNAKQFNQQYRSNLIGQAIGQPTAYTPPQLQAAPQSLWEKYGSSATTAIGAGIGGYFGGPQGLAAGAQAGQGIGNSLFGR